MTQEEVNPLARLRQFAPLALILASASVAVAAYLQALNYPFMYDDAIYITGNHKLAGLPLAELWRLFTEPYNSASEFLPLRDLSYWIDLTLFGLNPAAFRVHNILLYLFSLPLVYGTTLRLWQYFRPADAASAPWAAATVTALFALHPALVQSVVWISGRKYMLANLFSMLALWFAVRARREQDFPAPYAVAALVAFVAVMLSKSSYVAMAPVIALLWVVFWCDIPASNRRRSLLLWPLAILLLAGLLVQLFIASSGETERYFLEHFYFGIELITRILAVLGWLARLAVSPETRHFNYPVFEYQYFSVMVSFGVAVLAVTAIGAVMLRRRSLEGFALVAFLLLCMPHLQVIPYAPPSFVSDRFLTLALWPAVLLVVTLSWRLKPAPRIALLLAVALPFGFQTTVRPRDFSSKEALLAPDLRAYPGYFLPAMDKITAVQLPQGLYREATETANSITPPEFRDIMIGIIQAHYAVNVLAASTGKPQEAIDILWNLDRTHKQLPVQVKWNSPIKNLWDLKRDILAIESDDLAKRFPHDITVRYNAGLWMLDAHEYDEAAAHFRVATALPQLPEALRGQAFKNLGLALLRSGRVAEAEAPLRTALEQSPPDMRAHCLLSEVYKQTGRLDEAARAEASCPSRLLDGKAAQ